MRDQSPRVRSDQTAHPDGRPCARQRQPQAHLLPRLHAISKAGQGSLEGAFHAPEFVMHRRDGAVEAQADIGKPQILEFLRRRGSMRVPLLERTTWIFLDRAYSAIRKYLFEPAALRRKTERPARENRPGHRAPLSPGRWSVHRDRRWRGNRCSNARHLRLQVRVRLQTTIGRRSLALLATSIR